jgi:hypothetical protein
MPIIGLPSLAMLLVLANIALCLTAESQKRGLLAEPTFSTYSAVPLGGTHRRDRASATARLLPRPD